MASSSQDTQDSLEWEYAKAALAGKPDGSKLRRTQSKKDPLYKRLEKHGKRPEPQTGNTTLRHSYLKYGTTVFRIGEILGKGTYGKVRVLSTEDGALFTVKVSKYTYLPSEVSVLLQQGYALGEPTSRMQVDRQTGESFKYYLPMKHLGRALNVHLLKSRLNTEARIDIAIDLCLAMHRLHHVLGHAHLDMRPQNTVINRNGEISLIDYGATEPDPAGLAHNPMGTFDYRPPRSLRYTREELDSIALMRTIYFPADFYDATQAANDRLAARSYRTPWMYVHTVLKYNDLKAINLRELFTTDSNTVEGFKHRHRTPLYLAARLICAKHKVALEDQDLTPMTCLLLASLHQQKKDSETIKAAIADPESWMRDHIGETASPSDNLHIIRAKFICRSLEIDWTDALHAQAETLYRFAQIPGFLLHFKMLTAQPELLQRLSAITEPETLSQVKILLDNIPSRDLAWRIARINAFLENPGIAPVNPLTESALALSMRYQLGYTYESLQEDPRIARLINRLESVNIAHLTPRIMQIPAFVDLLINDSAEHDLPWMLVTEIQNITMDGKLRIIDFLATQAPQDLETIVMAVLYRQSDFRDILPILDDINRINNPAATAVHIRFLIRHAQVWSKNDHSSRRDDLDVIKAGIRRELSALEAARTMSTAHNPPASSSETPADVVLHSRLEALSRALNTVSVKAQNLPDGPKKQALTDWHTGAIAARGRFNNAPSSQPLAERLGTLATEILNLSAEQPEQANFRDTINEHRGILGLFDNMLRGIVAFVRALTCQYGLPQRGTFFKTESQNLIDTVHEHVNTLQQPAT